MRPSDFKFRTIVHSYHCPCKRLFTYPNIVAKIQDRNTSVKCKFWATEQIESMIEHSTYALELPKTCIKLCPHQNLYIKIKKWRWWQKLRSASLHHRTYLVKSWLNSGLSHRNFSFPSLLLHSISCSLFTNTYVSSVKWPEYGYVKTYILACSRDFKMAAFMEMLKRPLTTVINWCASPVC